ncbi:hypothetical protein BB8028_0002g12020 [Beauveria bassiana]|uniref:Methyltransferase domain-containing protein n=1 Tax=Beauveria bassiana TaxID=176275 RepID=A0A2S7Y4C5_BEABA|nr:hypothetical protein BB8028_0002g12020 [Beauveria bassiana]
MGKNLGRDLVFLIRARPLKRILYLGCGWGVLTRHQARTFPDCPSVDAANLSLPQLRYCADKLPMDLAHRVNLNQCNLQAVGRPPDPGTPYDFVFVRCGFIACPPSLRRPSRAWRSAWHQAEFYWFRTLCTEMKRANTLQESKLF